MIVTGINYFHNIVFWDKDNFSNVQHLRSMLFIIRLFYDAINTSKLSNSKKKKDCGTFLYLSVLFLLFFFDKVQNA